MKHDRARVSATSLQNKMRGRNVAGERNDILIDPSLGVCVLRSLVIIKVTIIYGYTF